MVRGEHVKYGGNLTGGSLLVRESRIIASFMLSNADKDSIAAKVVDENLLQNNTPGTSRKYCRLILSRLTQLSQAQLIIVAEGSEESVRMVLFSAVLKSYPLVTDFFREVVLDKIKCFEPKLDKMDWFRFLETRETIDPRVKEWTESSRKKMGQVIIRMLCEAGYMDNTRSLSFQFPQVPFDVSDVLVETGDNWILSLLKLGKAA